FFIVLAPTSSFIPLADVMVEHRVYLASSIVIIGVVLTVDHLLRRMLPTGSQFTMRSGVSICVCAVALGLGWRTWTRNADYHTNLSLWLDTTQTNPMNARAWNNLGGVY